MDQAWFDILHRMKQHQNILVAISSSHAASRQKLKGIYRYASRMGSWDITLVRSHTDLTPQLLTECASGTIDGFILSSDECSSEISNVIPRRKPLVAIEVGAHIHPDRRHDNTILLSTDNKAIGKMAAECFRSLGNFASYVYIPDELHRSWSDERGEAFARAVSAIRHRTEIYDSSQESLSSFLSRQELPVAAFTAWDFVAAKVIRTCHKCKLAIPGQVSVIGVDDDDLICESVRPPLSTVLIDRVKQGFMAARTLDLMMRPSRHAPASSYICGPVKIIERETTAHLPSGISVVKRARKFIEDNVTSISTVQDVADAVRVSRRLLDLRFAESGAGSVARLIRERKLALVKRLLRQTSLTDSRVAARCGFKSAGSLRNLFRRVYGSSMSAYRHQKA